MKPEFSDKELIVMLAACKESVNSISFSTEPTIHLGSSVAKIRKFIKSLPQDYLSKVLKEMDIGINEL